LDSVNQKHQTRFLALQTELSELQAQHAAALKHHSFILRTERDARDAEKARFQHSISLGQLRVAELESELDAAMSRANVATSEIARLRSQHLALVDALAADSRAAAVRISDIPSFVSFQADSLPPLSQGTIASGSLLGSPVAVAAVSSAFSSPAWSVVCKLTGPDCMCPTGLALDDVRSTLFVTHDETHCVQAWRLSFASAQVERTCSWRKIWQYGVSGHPGAGTGQLNFPSGCAYDPCNHELFVVDSANHRVVVLHGDTGQFVRTFGQYGPKGAGLHFPRYIALAALRVSTPSAIDVESFADDGNSSHQTAALQSPSRVPLVLAVSDVDARVHVLTDMGVKLYALQGYVRSSTHL
jgi:hypothetical protein